MTTVTWLNCLTCVYFRFCYIEVNLRRSFFSVILSVIMYKMISKSVLNLEFVLSLGEKNSMTYEKLIKKYWRKRKKYIKKKKSSKLKREGKKEKEKLKCVLIKIGVCSGQCICRDLLPLNFLYFIGVLLYAYCLKYPELHKFLSSFM